SNNQTMPAVDRAETQSVLVHTRLLRCIGARNRSQKADGRIEHANQDHSAAGFRTGRWFGAHNDSELRTIFCSRAAQGLRDTLLSASKLATRSVLSAARRVLSRRVLSELLSD